MVSIVPADSRHSTPLTAEGPFEWGWERNGYILKAGPFQAFGSCAPMRRFWRCVGSAFQFEERASLIPSRRDSLSYSGIHRGGWSAFGSPAWRGLSRRELMEEFVSWSRFVRLCHLLVRRCFPILETENVDVSVNVAGRSISSMDIRNRYCLLPSVSSSSLAIYLIFT
jgi:hypothetical protein